MVIRVASPIAEQLKTYDPRKLGKIRKVSKLHRAGPVPSPPAKIKTLLILAKTLDRQKLNFSPSALFHMKTRVSLNYFVND